MPGTLQGLLVLVLAVLPGAMYVWGFEREAGKWGIGLSDAVLRFVVASAVFQVVFAAPLYQLADDGSFVKDEHGDFVRLGSRILVGWEEMRFLEFFPLPSADEPDEETAGRSDR